MLCAYEKDGNDGYDKGPIIEGRNVGKVQLQ